MKKATRIIIILLAIATLLAIYLPESDAGKAINSTINVQKAADSVKNTMEDGADAMGDMADTVKDTVEDGVDAVVDGVDGAVDVVKDEAGEALDGVEDAIEDILEEVEDAVDGNDEEAPTEGEMEDEMEMEGDNENEEVVITNNGYVEFDAEAVDMAVSEGKNVALFFHADRCGTCKALSSDITENEATIDDNTVIFKVDYDSSKELKSKYGVSKQHTIVYLDENMEATGTEQGLVNLDAVLNGFAK